MKRIVSMLAAAVLMTETVSAAAVNAGADTSPAAEYDGCLYHYQVISDTEKTAEILSAEGLSGRVELPSQLDGYKITGLDTKAFFGNTDITEVYFPAEIKNIGSYAFSGCLSLRKAVLADETEYIGEGCFMGCNSLVRVSLGKTIEAIPERCFYSCTSLNYAEIPYSVIGIGSEAYFGCGDVSGIRIPPNVKHIGADAIGIHYDIRSSSNAVISGFRVSGLADSIAQTYAEQYSIKFKRDYGEMEGDADLNGRLTTSDATRVLVECSKLAQRGNDMSLSMLQFQNSDMNHDNRITTVDATRIMKKCAEIQMQYASGQN